MINGKSDGNIRADAGTQVMGGLLPAMLRPGMQRGLIVGLGTGSTAGWFAAVPEVQRVDVVELEPATLEMARLCASANLNVLENPKVRVHIADAREVLLSTRESYDFIFSEPSNPYRAGIASLFTRDFYEAATRRLTPNGVFAQWLQAYEIDGQAVRSAFATLGSVFPNVQTWQTQGGDFILIASNSPITLDAEALKQRIGQEPFRSALINAWQVDTLEGVLAHFIAGEQLTRVVVQSGVTPITDDRNSLEFGFARTVGRRAGERMSDQLHKVALDHACAVPVIRGAVDWEAVNNQILAAGLRTITPTSTKAEESPAVARRAFIQAYLKEEFEYARREWNNKPFEPRSLLELSAVAESLARTGDPQAWRFIEQLYAVSPHEAEALVAAAFASEKRWPEATEHLQNTFAAWQSDPWPRMELIGHTLALAEYVAKASKQPSIAKVLYESIQKPFAVGLAWDNRIASMLKIAQSVDSQAVSICVNEALKEYGNNFPWQRWLLQLRVQAYQTSNDPRLQSAIEDLLRFSAAEMQPFDRGLRVPNQPALAKQP
ncbi:MAG: hypothetical protein EOP84_14995 [Verrucomicrobiaceae bacterium]|nr:MAG: hypothetical protein EOP84_14995 [Verrucomicrobiaceae bacterium]